MTITTDKGKTFDVNYAWGPVRWIGEKSLRLMIELAEDERPLSEICSDFEGVQTFERKDDNEGDMTFEGYTDLVSASRDTSRGTVTLALRMEG